MIVGVLVQLSNKNIDKIFDYKVDEDLVSKIKVGIRVEVPFGHQVLEGFVLEIKKESSTNKNLRNIISIKDSDVILNEELLELGKKIKENTLSTLISCYQVMLPKALKAKRGTNINKKYNTYYKLGDVSDYKFNKTQQVIIDLFKDNKLVKREDILKISISSLNTLIKKKVLIPVKLEKYRMNYENKFSNKNKLTADQENVINEFNKYSSYNTFLLHGVTGSGKTEVYMELIENVLKEDKTSIVLVPEISLTPQMVERFQNRFGNKIAALHSALSDGEKYDEWRRISRGEASIVIGARSAIFAPLKNIGLIVIDEEHSDSYKQDDSNPRYHARDIAIMRAKYHNCPVILGSATPTLESFARANKGVYKLLELPNRINKNLPVVKVINMSDEIKNSKGHFSESLMDAIRDKLNKKEQVILFLNRRGYSSFVSCKNCGYTFKCPHCDITLTYHKTSNTLRCHYCGYGTKVYKKCPSCNEESIIDLGVGTEKVEEELHKYLPNSKVLRMDIDTTSRKGMHAKMIEAFKNHEYDILLGTQIVAKGLDFENVTLVGVINADTSLNIPDFRSSENTFSLLSQVAGRSGRSSKQGEVIIQTYNPEHYAIAYTKEHDYNGFYNKEMQIRKILKYPPFYYICYVRISGKDMNYVFNEANKIKRSFDRNFTNTIILGPSPANIFKMNKIYRYGIILKYKKEDNLYLILEKVLDHYKSDNNIRIDIDFNPSHL